MVLAKLMVTVFPDEPTPNMDVEGLSPSSSVGYLRRGIQDGIELDGSQYDAIIDAADVFFPENIYTP